MNNINESTIQELENMSDIFSIQQEKLSDIGLVDYDEIINDDEDNEIEGRHKKNYFRIDSSVLHASFDKIKSQNYITHFDNLLSGEMMLEKVSVMKKNLSKKAIIHECLSSNILNFYGLNVPYNFYTHHTNQTGKHHRLISIDFLGANQSFATFDDLKILSELPETKIRNVAVIANSVHSFFNSKQNLHKYKNQISKIEKDIIMTSLVRSVLLRDSDFCGLNIALILDKKSKNLSLINYDFESAFSDSSFDEIDLHCLKQARLHFPKLYNDFIEKTKLLYSTKDNIQIEYLDSYHQKCVEFLYKRLEKIQRTTEDFETTQLSVFDK